MGDGGGLGRVEHTTNSVCIRMRVYVVWELDFGLWATELSIAVNIYTCVVPIAILALVRSHFKPNEHISAESKCVFNHHFVCASH